jgi:transposase-like protein
MGLRLERVEELFLGRHFDREVIILCVRWYLRYKLSFRDLVEMMAERGLQLAHTTIMRWVQRYVPEFEKRWARYMRQSGRSWRVDETYIKVRGDWVYLYRAVDRDGNTVDFRLSPKRDVAAAKAFFRKALRTQGRAPMSITLDGYAASHRAVREMPNDNRLWKHTRLRSSKYLNNLIEQDHRGIKARTNPMLGFKSFSSLPLPEWSCFGVSIRLNSPSVASASKTKLRLHSGMQSSLLDLKHRRQLHADHQKICTRATNPLFHAFQNRRLCLGRDKLNPDDEEREDRRDI